MMLTNWSNFLHSQRRRLIHGTILLFIGLLYFYVVIPVFHVHIPCVFREITGFFCPGCGMTRCLRALLQLDFYQAFRYNMLPFVLLPLFLLYTFLQWKRYATASNVTMVSMLVIAIGYGVLRNIEYFAWLAPTNL